MNKSGKRLQVRLPPEYAVKLETLYERFSIDGNSDSDRIRKLLDALSSVSQSDQASDPRSHTQQDSKAYETYDAERIPNDQLPLSINCPFAGPFRQGKEIWVFCDNEQLRGKRGTNKVPLAACLQCDTRNRQSKQKQPQREAQALPAPTTSSSPFSNLTFLRSSFSKARILIMVERFDLLTSDLRQAIEWGLANTDQISDIDKTMLDQLREKLRKKKE